MPPAQIGELREVAIEADPFAPVLECERGVLGVGDEGAAGLGTAAQLLEDPPMAIAGPNDSRVRPDEEAVGEAEGVVEGSRYRECARVRRDPDEGAEDELGERERFGRVDDGLEQPPGDRVMVLSGTVRVEQDVDVEEDHESRSSSSISFRRASLSLMSISAGELSPSNTSASNGGSEARSRR